MPRHHFSGAVWRVTPQGRDPLLAGKSQSRWCNGTFDVLYTSLTRQGALAEIFALYSSQPVFPSKIRSVAHTIEASSGQTLRLVDLAALENLGVRTQNYSEREYGRTQEIADAAYFLGFSGLLVPSARWHGENLVLFTDHIDPEGLRVVASDADPIDWSAWRAERRGTAQE